MSKTAKGVAPGFILIPAREYEWELCQRVSIQIPNKGEISKFLSENELDSRVKLPGDNEFSIMEDGVLQLWEVVRVLFAKADYPNLKDDECFNVVALEFDDNLITLHGEILRYL